MEFKLVLLLLFGLTGFFIILSRKNPLKSLFWLGIFSLFIRQLSIPIIDSLDVGFFIFTIIVLLNPFILFNKKQFNEWFYWYLVLLFGIINSLTFGQSKEFFVNQDILTKSLDWTNKFLVIIVISSSITYYVKTVKDLKKLMNLFLLSCFIFSFTAIMAYFDFYDGVVIYGQGSFNDVQDFSSDNIYSVVYGISSSNLIFGVSTTAIVFIPYLNWKKWQKHLFLAIIVFSIIISLKRLAIITLILALIYYVLIEKKKGSNIWLLIIALIFLSVGTSYYDLVYKRFFGAVNSLTDTGIADSSSDVRISRYNLAWDLFSNNPFIGQGAGYVVFIHNGFLEILANLGIVGLVLFKPLIKPLKNIKTSFYNPWAIALILIMITLVALEAAINRVEIMYFIGLLYGGFLVSTKLRINTNNE